MASLDIDPKKAALVLIDLQQGIVTRPGSGPRSGADVVKNAARLAARFRQLYLARRPEKGL